MEIQRNMAAVMRAMKESRGKSLTEFSAELEISRSALQEYLSGSGNPNVSTIEHLAEKLELDPILLLTGAFTGDELQVLLRLVEQLQFLSGLDAARRIQFAQKLLELIRLWNGGEDGG